MHMVAPDMVLRIMDLMGLTDEKTTIVSALYKIEQVVGSHTGVWDLKKRSRKRAYTYARKLFTYASRKFTSHDLAEIGNHIGYNHHSSVITNNDALISLMQTEEHTKQDVEAFLIKVKEAIK